MLLLYVHIYVMVASSLKPLFLFILFRVQSSRYLFRCDIHLSFHVDDVHDQVDLSTGQFVIQVWLAGMAFIQEDISPEL